MNWVSTPYLFTPFGAAAISLGLAVYSRRFRGVPGALAFSWLMAAYAEWSVMYAMILLSPNLPAQIIFAKLGYLGAVVIAPAWLAFTVSYTGMCSWLNQAKARIFLIPPIVTLLLVFTNEWHGLIWQKVWMAEGMIQVDHGPFYWVFLVFSYGSFLLGLALLVRKLVHSAPPFRMQAAAVLAGGLVTWFATLSYVIQLTGETIKPNLSPLAILISGLLFGWGMLRHQLLALVPIAREAIVEHIRDGVVVVDKAGRIVDSNPAAAAILGIKNSALVGQLAKTTLSEFPLTGCESGHEEGGAVEVEHLGRDLEIRAWPLFSRSKVQTGCLVVLRDVTDRRQWEQAEREQRVLAEALRDSAAALNSTLSLEEVLDRILANIGRVVEHDAASLMIVEEGVARVVRHRGYSDERPAAVAERALLRVSETPILRRMEENGQPTVVSNTHTDTSWVKIPSSKWIGSYVGTPVRVKGETVGFINLNSTVPGFYNGTHADRLKAFADQAAIAMVNARMYGEIQQAALTDALTGAYNRRALYELGRREVDRAQRFNRPLAAVMVDIDNFKEINDAFGHLAGDEVLCGLVQCLRTGVRDVDIVGRYGGDEFFFLLLENDSQTAVKVADRVSRTFEEWCLHSSLAIRCTISAGVADVGPHTWDFEDLVEQVDAALYRAKEAGRNHVAV